MGNVRTDHIKRVARELIRRYPNKFSGNFDENKRLVSQLVQGATSKVRNQIAGYITGIYSGLQPQKEEVSPEKSG
ncbi:MAG: 30S ribosomal protein S17e [Candidatus Bathyarchaeia archaeon]